mgnify:CR=1 FL=1|jgi:putative membrane protein
MQLIAVTATVLVAFLHFYIMYLEMFLWEKPKGLKTFGLQPDFAKQTKVLAANQGLYNGFLAAGLLWSVWLGSQGTQVALFFLLCVIVAGIYGAMTANKKILFVQGIPGFIAFLAVLLAS